MQTLDIKSDYRWHVLQYYNRHASRYDLMEFIRRGTRRKALRLCGWQPGEKVLDMCTGTGDLALTFAAQGAAVVGIDIARGMLRRAFAKGSGSKSDSSWVEMDATALAFAEDAFDISVLSLALHHMPLAIQSRVLAELRRVTSRRIVIIEPRTPTNPRLLPIWARIASVIDESEYMHEWVHQDFASTCQAAQLDVESIYVTSLGVHRILVCNPQGGTAAA